MKRKENKNLMTAYEVRDYLRIPLSTLYDLTRTKRIKAVKVGRQWRYSKNDIEKYLNSGEGLCSKLSLEKDERRKNPRMNCFIQSNFIIAIPEMKEVISSGRITNISAGGAFIENSNNCTMFREIKTCDPILLWFSLNGENGNGNKINIYGRVLRKQNGSMAIKFKKLSKDIKEKINDYVG